MQQVDASGEIAADLAFVETLRQMRARFQADIAAASLSADPDVGFALRQENFFQFAEFFYALRAHGIDSPEKLGRLAHLHNDHLVGISQDRDRMRRYGLTPARIQSAMFTGENLHKLLANFARPRPSIDQSDLARLLVTVMSSETCRKLVIVAEQAGFVDRERSAFGTQLVVSGGAMERIYGNAVREARRAAMQV